jgi:hypothetical protein
MQEDFRCIRAILDLFAGTSGLITNLDKCLISPIRCTEEDVTLAPTQEDFRCIRAILDLFAGASGLITNLDKCLVSPIRCTEEDVTLVQHVFPCQL